MLGAWEWDPVLGVGLVAELDEGEALTTFRAGRTIVLGILAVTVLLSVLLTSLTIWSGERAKLVLQQARDDWERVAEERTADLRESEERGRLLLESAGEGIFGVDAEGHVTFMNPVAEEMLGLERGEMIGRAVHEHIHHSHEDGSDYPVAECPMYKAYTHGERADVDDEVLWRKDGVCFPSTTRARPSEQDGSLVGAVITFSDITEQKDAEQGLRKLSQAVEQSSSSIVITARDGTIEYVNPTFCEITGYSREEAIGANPRVLKSGAHDATFYADLWTKIESGSAWHGEMCNRKKNGELYWEQVSIAPIRDATNQVTHYVAVKDDITERRAAQEEVRRVNFLSDMALEMTGSGYWLADYSDPDYYYPSDRAVEILGEVEKEDGRYHLQDEWFARLVEASPEIAQQTAELYEGAVEGRYETYEATYPYRRPATATWSGSTRTDRWSATRTARRSACTASTRTLPGSSRPSWS